MKVVGTCRVVDALGEWGSHNTPWRAKRQISDASEGADFALTYYSQLVCGILALTPFACVRAEISADDIPQLRLYQERSCIKSEGKSVWPVGDLFTISRKTYFWNLTLGRFDGILTID